MVKVSIEGNIDDKRFVIVASTKFIAKDMALTIRFLWAFHCWIANRIYQSFRGVG
uniref:Uncharacterized protein n=1 Tax=Phakopsora pachyrhizi TaxID=170000 RepID=A0A0S1MJ29_PHAPC